MYGRINLCMRRKPLQRARPLPRCTRGIEEFFDQVTPEGEKPKTGRAWTASELRLKSFSDLHKLWFVLLKEKNMLLTQREKRRQTKDHDDFKSPIRLRKVRKSMARIKFVVHERKIVVDKAKLEVRELYRQKLSQEKLKVQDEYLKHKMLNQDQEEAPKDEDTDVRASSN
eukprot:TRINITY_DN11022_c0_g1_i1.p1 TRINITY_DN11022_c0_g1~~TRINITY_DN11022_c0_g1_i1.p1  ORF type:complete len:170 (-),score=24.18 TRINITY_DN11022_c0_g1_i1:41-550(-)